MNAATKHNQDGGSSKPISMISRGHTNASFSQDERNPDTGENIGHELTNTGKSNKYVVLGQAPPRTKHPCPSVGHMESRYLGIYW